MTKNLTMAATFAILFCFQVCLASASFKLDRLNDRQSVVEDFVCPSQGGFYAVPGECTGNYYSCVDGEAFLLKCPGNSIFDPEVGVCVPPEVASCKTTTTTTVAPFICPTQSGFYAIPGECSGNYYSCVNGEPYVMTCPGSSIFDPVQKVCVPEQDASCKDSTTTVSSSSDSTTSRTTTSTSGGTSSTSGVTSGPFNCPDNFGVYPVPGVPCSNQFWKCSNGYAYLMTCPEPTIYNPQEMLCDWPYNVPGCGGAKKRNTVGNQQH